AGGDLERCGVAEVEVAPLEAAAAADLRLLRPNRRPRARLRRAVAEGLSLHPDPGLHRHGRGRGGARGGVAVTAVGGAAVGCRRGGLMSSRDATLRHGVANAGLRWLIVAAVSMIGVGTVVFLKSWDTGGTADLRDRERIVASQRQASGAGTSGRGSGS